MLSTRKHLAEMSRLRSEHERDRREWARERKDLLDRIMFLSGKPWELPADFRAPAEPPAEPEEDIDYSPDQAFDELEEAYG